MSALKVGGRVRLKSADQLIEFLAWITLGGCGWRPEPYRWSAAWRIGRAALLARRAAHEAFETGLVERAE